MTTVEKLLLQTFERKNSIVEQVKQQTELYTQHLASKLFIDGITPPSWLGNPNTSSNSNELIKEELISKLLCPYPQPSACFSVAQYPLYNNLIVRGDNEEYSDGIFMENLAFSQGVDKQHHSTKPPLSSDDRVEYDLNHVPELDISVTSPDDQTGERIVNIHNASDHPLAGIYRSKSRQNALQFRNSAKSLAKSGVSNDNIRDSYRWHGYYSVNKIKAPLLCSYPFSKKWIPTQSSPEKVFALWKKKGDTTRVRLRSQAFRTCLHFICQLGM